MKLYRFHTYTTSYFFPKTTKETIIYTIDFTVLKNDNGNWILQTNQEDIIPKLLGMK